MSVDGGRNEPTLVGGWATIIASSSGGGGGGGGGES